VSLRKMEIDDRLSQVAVPQQDLDGTDVGAGFEKVSRKAMPQGFLILLMICCRERSAIASIPRYGVEVEVIRRLRKTDSSILIVRAPGRPPIAISEWMLNPEICDRFMIQENPRIDIGALMDLRRLIDAQQFNNANDGCCAESPTGGGDAQQRRSARPATSTALRRRPDLDRTSRISAGTMPNALAPGAGKRSQSQRTEAE
jgi:hypothetical protein